MFLRLASTKHINPLSSWRGAGGEVLLILFPFLLSFLLLLGCRPDFRKQIDAALQTGDNQQAMALLNRAIADSPTAEWLWKRAELSAKLGKDVDALRDYDRLLNLSLATNGSHLATYVPISEDSMLNVNEVYCRQLLAHIRLGQMRLAENKLEQMREYLYDKGQTGKYYYWKGLIAKSNKDWTEAYSFFIDAALQNYPNARAQLKEMSKRSGMPLNWPADLDSMNLELHFTDGNKWPIGNALQGEKRLVKVECKHIEVTNIRRFIMKNYLNDAALRAIPNIAGKEKQVAPVCIVTVGGNNLCFTELPGSHQLTHLRLDASGDMAKPNAQQGKPQMIEVWVMKYEDAHGQRNCEVYIR